MDVKVFFFPISKICHHDFDTNDIETEGGFRNCGHFDKMRLPPHEPRKASQSLVWLSAQVLVLSLVLSHYLFPVMLLRRESRPSFPS